MNTSLPNESSDTMNISLRRALMGEEFHLWEVFQSSVHGVAKHHYTPEQLNAWAPPVYPGAAIGSARRRAAGRSSPSGSARCRNVVTVGSKWNWVLTPCF